MRRVACGIDRIYPAGNRRLAGEILELGGLLVSEYPPGEEILKFRFPGEEQDNRGNVEGVRRQWRRPPNPEL